MRILNIGGGPRTIPLPPFYQECDVDWLDIDPTWEPDLVLDARDLDALDAGGYDGVYGSHILEHFAPHDLHKVLAGVLHVLKPDGFADFRVPNITAAIQAMMDNDGDPYTFLYQSGPGPITTRDMLYGYAPFVEQYGECQCHRNGFTRDSLVGDLLAAGFENVYSRVYGFEVRAIAGKGEITTEQLEKLRALR